MRLHFTPGRAVAVVISTAFAMSMVAPPAANADNEADLSYANGVITYTAPENTESNVVVYEAVNWLIVYDDGTNVGAFTPDPTSALQALISSSDCGLDWSTSEVELACDLTKVTVNRVVVNTLDMADAVTTDQPGRRVDITGGGGADFLDAGGERNTISGNGGADEVWSGGGADTLYGNFGPDSLHGQGGNDFIKGGPGSDQLFGNDGSDYLSSRDTFKDWDYGGLGADQALANAIDLVYSAVRL